MTCVKWHCYDFVASVEWLNLKMNAEDGGAGVMVVVLRVGIIKSVNLELHRNALGTKVKICCCYFNSVHVF